MKPVVHPPDAVLRAYGDLIGHVFLFLRGQSQDELDGEQLFDLADAMHNIAAIVVDYGDWTDDEKYRESFLRPFDKKWGQTGICFEEYLESRISNYLTT